MNSGFSQLSSFSTYHMNILIYTQYFVPESNAPANRWGYFARYLVRQGHQVTVLTSFPHHPQGKIFPGYKNKWRQTEEKDGIKIIRSWTYISSSRKFLPRLLNYLSFAFSSYRNSASLKNLDLIIVSSPPLFVALQGKRIAQRKKIPLILDLRDIWPEAAVSTGYLRRGLIYRWADRKAKGVYRTAQKILVNSPAMLEELEKEGVSREKLVFLPNGADLDLFSSRADSSVINQQYHLEGKFVVLYTGLLGFAQAPEIMIKAADLLKDTSDIVLLIVGIGPLYQSLKPKSDNVILVGAKPHKEIPNFIARADLCLIPYKNKETFKKNIPSKMYEYMAGGKAIIINLEGAAGKIIREAKAGLIVEPENPQALAEGILKLYQSQALRKEMEENSRSYGKEHGDRRIISQKLENILQDVIKK